MEHGRKWGRGDETTRHVAGNVRMTRTWCKMSTPVRPRAEGLVYCFIINDFFFFLNSFLPRPGVIYTRSHESRYPGLPYPRRDIITIIVTRANPFGGRPFYFLSSQPRPILTTAVAIFVTSRFRSPTVN